jgi:16S rRNA processing protein RimM
VVAPESDFAEERFRIGAAVYMRRDGEPSVLTVRTSRAHAGRWIVGFDGVSSIDEAEALRDVELRIAADAVRPLGPGAYYLHDLVGCDVRTIAGARVGRVSRVEMRTGVPMLVVGEGDEVLVPFAEPICRAVDLTARTIAIDPPEGLVELNRPAARR